MDIKSSRFLSENSVEKKRNLRSSNCDNIFTTFHYFKILVSRRNSTMFKYSFLLIELVLLASCNINDNKKGKTNLVQRDIRPFAYIYHFYKSDFEKSHIEPSAYKPKLYNLEGSVSARLYPSDTLIRFVVKSKNKKLKADSTVEFFRRVKLAGKDSALIPANLLGCQLLGVYNSLNEDMEDDFYFCFYLSDQNDLLKVAHFYRPGNVHAAFYFTNDSIDPTTRYKKDMVNLLALQRPQSFTDTVHIKF